jgi:hypothetical protein
VQAALGDPALEALDASTRVYELLPARVERMAVGADLYVQLVSSGAREELVPARATHVRTNVVWVDLGLHRQPILAGHGRQLALDCPVVVGVVLLVGATAGCSHLGVRSSSTLITWPLAFNQRNRTSPRYSAGAARLVTCWMCV